MSLLERKLQALSLSEMPPATEWLLKDPTKVTLRDESAVWVGRPNVEHQSRGSRDGKVDWANPFNYPIRDQVLAAFARSGEGSPVGLDSNGLPASYRISSESQAHDLQRLLPCGPVGLDRELYRDTRRRVKNVWGDLAQDPMPRPVQDARSHVQIMLNASGILHKGTDPRVTQDARFAVDADGNIRGSLSRVLLTPFDTDGSVFQIDQDDSQAPFERALYELTHVLAHPYENEIIRELLRSRYLGKAQVDNFAEVVARQTNGKPWATNVGIEVEEPFRRLGIAGALNVDASQFVYVGASKRALIERLRGKYGHQTVAFGLPRNLSPEQRAVVAAGFASYSTWISGLSGGSDQPTPEMIQAGIMAIPAEDEDMGQVDGLSPHTQRVLGKIQTLQARAGNGDGPLYFASVVSY